MFVLLASNKVIISLSLINKATEKIPNKLAIIYFLWYHIYSNYIYVCNNVHMWYIDTNTYIGEIYWRKKYFNSSLSITNLNTDKILINNFLFYFYLSQEISEASCNLSDLFYFLSVSYLLYFPRRVYTLFPTCNKLKSILDECQENRQVASHRLHCRRKTLEVRQGRRGCWNRSSG